MKETKQKKPFTGEHGATMVEFTFSALILFGVIGAIFDLGIGLRNYSLLTTATSAVVREISVQTSCGDANQPELVKARAQQRAQRYMVERYGVVSGVSFTPEYDAPNHLLRLEGKWKMNCLMCILSPAELSLKSTSTAKIERAAWCT